MRYAINTDFFGTTLIQKKKKQNKKLEIDEHFKVFVRTLNRSIKRDVFQP